MTLHSHCYISSGTGGPEKEAEQVERSEADCGILEKLVLRNFLCHNALQISFGPNVTFIHGKNGSACAYIYIYIYIY